MQTKSLERALGRLRNIHQKRMLQVMRDGEKGDKKLQRMIQYRPNMYMNGKDFLYKVRTLLEIHNIVFYLYQCVMILENVQDYIRCPTQPMRLLMLQENYILSFIFRPAQ